MFFWVFLRNKKKALFKLTLRLCSKVAAALLKLLLLLKGIKAEGPDLEISRFF